MPRFQQTALIAHRGLHDLKSGIVENTVSAFQAAMRCGYAIETDLQPDRESRPVVFHDERLERLTTSKGGVSEFSTQALKTLTMRGTQDRIISLPDLLELVGGHVPLFLEIKSAPGRKDRTLEKHIAASLAGYRGQACIMSFDPGSVAAMRRHAPAVPRGLSARRYGRHPKDGLSPLQSYRLTHMLDIPEVRPDFLTYEINDLAAMEPALRRRNPTLPILCWTVRTAEERRKARLHADGMIFEGFRPEQ